MVLDRKYSGLVIGMDSRMHCFIDKNHSSKISVRSPQFSDGKWEYILDGCNVIPTNGSNKFVQISLAFVCHLMGPNRIWGLDIRLMADNDFYSQSEYLTSKGLDPTLENLKLVPKFNATGSKIATVSKTGLGTSATLVSALVAGLLIHFCVISPLGSKILPHDLGLIEKISQICHSAAQGKVGSGFDISAACHGSHIYTRFSPSLLEPFLDTHPNSYSVPELLQQPWDHKVISSRLPKGICILLVEVRHGSNTPQMVSKVMEWFNNNYNASTAFWSSIYETQSEFMNCLRRLHTMESSPQYDAVLNNLSDKVISTHSTILDSPVEHDIFELHKAGMVI